MKWTSISEEKLLAKSFWISLIGILLTATPLALRTFDVLLNVNMGWFNGPGIALQLLALSLAVLVIRRRKISHEIQGKAKQMTAIQTLIVLLFVLFA